VSRALALALLASCAVASPALAVQDPHAGRFDARVRTVIYNPLNVVRVTGGTLARACRHLGDSGAGRTLVHRVSARMELTDATLRPS